ncbi:MAG TPA: fumarylacetoacetate hydrolase family protein [Woeseiaceae bacterium]|nr:fumarylacetoacetate hydrolase family protein [Woeseiaceae bacterium]
MKTVFEPPAPVTAAVKGSDLAFPVHRIYCVGRNYAAHAREMGADPEREPPFFFSKPADALVPNGATIPYPPRTANLHHEIELVVAIGKAGRNIAAAAAEAHVFGYAVGIDLTRRDLQQAAKEQGRPWDTAKGFDRSAPMTDVFPAEGFGHPRRGAIRLAVDGDLRQQADIADLTWSVPEIIAELSTLFELQPGDLIFTGTPAGVGPVEPGQTLVGYIEGLEELRTTIESAP